MPSLIGSAPNQVPTNGMLGTMAFQDADNVLLNNLNTVSLVISSSATAPTVTAGDKSSNIATTAFVGTASPAGQVAFFASSSAPAGWLKANGAAVSRTAYASLFSAIGTLYGNGDGSTTFNLPDLRGEFLRSFDDGRGVDGGRTIGSVQSAYAGSFYFKATADDGDTQSGAWKSVSNIEINGVSIVSLGAGEGTVYVTPGDARPRNIALLACIKY